MTASWPTAIRVCVVHRRPSQHEVVDRENYCFCRGKIPPIPQAMLVATPIRHAAAAAILLAGGGAWAFSEGWLPAGVAAIATGLVIGPGVLVGIVSACGHVDALWPPGAPQKDHSISPARAARIVGLAVLATVDEWTDIVAMISLRRAGEHAFANASLAVLVLSSICGGFFGAAAARSARRGDCWGLPWGLLGFSPIIEAVADARRGLESVGSGTVKIFEAQVESAPQLLLQSFYLYTHAATPQRDSRTTVLFSAAISLVSLALQFASYPASRAGQSNFPLAAPELRVHRSAFAARLAYLLSDTALRVLALCFFGGAMPHAVAWGALALYLVAHATLTWMTLEPVVGQRLSALILSLFGWPSRLCVRAAAQYFHAALSPQRGPLLNVRLRRAHRRRCARRPSLAGDPWRHCCRRRRQADGAGMVRAARARRHRPQKRRGGSGGSECRLRQHIKKGPETKAGILAGIIPFRAPVWCQWWCLVRQRGRCVVPCALVAWAGRARGAYAPVLPLSLVHAPYTPRQTGVSKSHTIQL